MKEAVRIEPLWYSFRGKPYQGTRPAFYNPSDFSWVAQFEAAYPAFSAELDAYLQHQQQFEPYFNQALVEREKSWKIKVFLLWRVPFVQHLKELPTLAAALDQIPGLLSASISVLEAGAVIRPHHGDTNGIIRCHLGIDIPGELPVCGLKVQEQARSWEEGKVVLFCDAQRHEAFNRTSHRRVVLIFDVIHPDYLGKEVAIASSVLSGLKYQQLASKRRWIVRLPGFVKGVIRVSIQLKLLILVSWKRRGFTSFAGKK